MTLPTIRKGRRPSWMTPYGMEGLGDVWQDRLWPEWPRWHGEEDKPSVDFYRKDGKYHLHASLPGVKKEDISIDIQNDVITVSGKRESEREEKEADYYLKESTYGSFSRSLRLPGKVKEEDVEATYKDGVLKVVMTPKEDKEKRKIEIKG